MASATEHILAGSRHRSELTAYCQRMLGSSVDAEDAVQETFLRAWRASGRFEGRASLRTWLYRIATNVCLDALARSARRPVPIEELPEPMIDISGEPDPFDRALTRETARSAVLAAVGLLPPRQRAALLLRDVLSWRANEAADLLGTSTAAVNSALQRARVTLQALDPEDMIEASDAEEGELVNRYVDALAEDDIDTLVALVSLEPAA